MAEKKKNIIILYPELAAYFLSCLKELTHQDSVTIYVFRESVKKEAPFDFPEYDSIHILDETNFTLNALDAFIKEKKPHLLYCAGWSNKKYVRAVLRNRQLTTLIGLDNKWTGNIKQVALSVLARPLFQLCFDYAFVPGEPQTKFAEKLGFKSKNIIKRAYSADYELFSKIHREIQPKKTASFPKKFLFVGRYKRIKGIFDLWKAFIEIQEENENEWELWCIGTGEEFDNRIEHPKIKHFGFIQPNDFQEYLEETGIYVLPSHFEPWGVSVHEMAISGFPLILSDAIGAGEVFLQEGVNGYSFKAHEVDELKETMTRFINMTDQELLALSENSRELSRQITPETWAKSLISIMA